MLKLNTQQPEKGWSYAHGKVILFGEHAVVYGVEAVAAAIPNAVRARARARSSGSQLVIASWGVEIDFKGGALGRDADQMDSKNELLIKMVNAICDDLYLELDHELDRELDQELHRNLKAAPEHNPGLAIKPFLLEIEPNLPPASGLGASAAIAVAATRALASYLQLSLSEERINGVAYKCEQLAHGTPSGLDNTLATYGGVLRFRRQDDRVSFTRIKLARTFRLLVAMSGQKGFTALTVDRVRKQREQEPEKYTTLFAQFSEVSKQGIAAIEAGDLLRFADCLNQNHVLLAEIGVSCEALERVLTIVKRADCEGAKLTGSGDGGAAVAFSSRSYAEASLKLSELGYEHLELDVTDGLGT